MCRGEATVMFSDINRREPKESPKGWKRQFVQSVKAPRPNGSLFAQVKFACLFPENGMLQLRDIAGAA